MFVYVVSVCDTFERECYIRVFSNKKGAKDFFEKVDICDRPQIERILRISLKKK